MKTVSARSIHRYLGFFLLGIMVVYALSGVILVFRSTNTFKVETVHHQVVAPGLEADALAEALGLRRLRGAVTAGDTIRFEGGTYSVRTGEADYSTWEYPVVIKQMTALHTKSTRDSVYALNLFFGLSLLFFSLSSLWMFRPQTRIFRQGMIAVVSGIVFTVVVLML